MQVFFVRNVLNLFIVPRLKFIAHSYIILQAAKIKISGTEYAIIFLILFSTYKTCYHKNIITT